MKKVKLTREQADAIEVVKNNPDDLVNTFLEYHVDHRHNYKDNFTPLSDLTIDEIAIALHVGYEVEETFDVGDWVVSECGLIGQFYEKYNTTYHFIDGDGVKHFSDNLRHATPEEIAEEKERRFFAKHDRAPWELWDKDLLISKSTGLIYEVEFATDDGVYFNIDSGARSWHSIKQNYLVACFYSDRKDVDNE